MTKAPTAESTLCNTALTGFPIADKLRSGFLGSVTKNLGCFKKLPKGTWGPLPDATFR